MLVYTPSNDYTDRSTSEAIEFKEFAIHTKSPVTVILLLGSDENEVVLNALHHLDQFAMKSTLNLQKLNELKLIDNIMVNNLIEHSDLFIRRFAFKIIAQIFQEINLSFENDLIQDILNKARKLYLEIEDNFIVEYSARILLRLMTDPRLTAKFQEDLQLISEGFYEHIRKSADPDVLHVSYQMLSQILRERFPTEPICDVDNFPFERTICDMSNKFMEIRKSALEVIAEVVLYKEDYIITRFCSRSFFDELFKIIESSEYDESHSSVLKILGRIVRHSPIAPILFTQYLDRFNNFWRNSPCVEECIHVYYGISVYEDAWPPMYATGVVEELANRLTDNTIVSYEICMVLSKVANHPKSFIAIMQAETVPKLISIVQNPAIDWKIKRAALETLNILCKKSYKACESTVTQNISTVLSTTLDKKYGEVPSEVFTNGLNLLISLARFEDVRADVMIEDLARALINATKNLSRSAVLAAHVFNTLSIFNNNSNLRECLTASNFWDIVLNYLKSPSTMLRNAVAEFIMHTGRSKNFAELYADKGILDLLLVDSSSIVSCSNWPAAIDSILSADLSLKFNIRGRLDFTDITNEDFFISKHHWKDVATFRSMIKDEVSPRHTLILVNFDRSECCEEDIVRVPKVCSDGMTLRSQDDCTYSRRPNDPFLPRYLEKAQNALQNEGFCNDPYGTNAGCSNIGKMADRAKILATIINEVFRCTIAGEDNHICSEESVTKHLNELKCDLNCNIIPLGLIRRGGHFERALLFKTLADRTGLPCTLQRGEDGKILWNELPIFNIQNTILPKQYLRPTHIVDLIHVPGALYPIGSRKAYEYIRLL